MNACTLDPSLCFWGLWEPGAVKRIQRATCFAGSSAILLKSFFLWHCGNKPLDTSSLFTKCILTEAHRSHTRSLFLLDASSSHSFTPIPITMISRSPWQAYHIEWWDKPVWQCGLCPHLRRLIIRGHILTSLLSIWILSLPCALHGFHLESDLRQNLNSKSRT